MNGGTNNSMPSSITNHDDETDHRIHEDSIKSLIEAIGLGHLKQSTSLPLVRRILYSNIGNYNDEDISANIKSASLMRKIERSLKSSVSTMEKDMSISSSSEYVNVERKMKEVDSLYRQLRKQESDSTAKKIMMVMNRLTGTQQNTPSIVLPSRELRHTQQKDLSSRYSSNVQHKYDSVNGNLQNDEKLNDDQSNNKKLNNTSTFSKIPSDRHVELAINEEERTIIRECLNSLQNIDGENIRFYRPSSKDSTQSKKNNHSLNPTVIPNSNVLMEHYEGIRVRPGLLPFYLDCETSDRLKSIRLVSSGALDALKICGEAGWLYSRIQAYIDNILNHTNPLSSSSYYGGDYSSDLNLSTTGVVPRALASALSKEVESYHSFLSSLEDERLTLTTRMLVSKLRIPISQLRTMALLVDDISPSLNGGQLLKSLYLHTMHGDVRHRDIVERILSFASEPWYDLLYDWIMQGMLSQCSLVSKSSQNETSKEFFIQEDVTVSDANLWHKRYNLNEDQIPYLPDLGNDGGIIHKALAEEILIVGKGINFIRRCLNDSEWSLNLESMMPQSADLDLKNVDRLNPTFVNKLKKLLGFYYNCEDAFPRDMVGRAGTIMTKTTLERVVNIASTQVHSHILTSLFQHHHLLEHLQGLKQVLFLGQGDFICALIDGLHAEFQKSKGSDDIYIHTMRGVLYDALRSTNAKFFPKYVTDRVHVKLLRRVENSTHNQFQIDDMQKEDNDGWDLFSLAYHVDAPLTAVVHPKAMEKYQQVFSSLFRLKRIDWMLNNTCKQSTELNHVVQIILSKYGDKAKVFQNFKILLQKFALTRQKMLHFISNLQSYVMFEVLESGWKNLVGKLRGARTLDEVILSHNEYLDKVLVKSLLGDIQSSQSSSFSSIKEKEGLNVGRHIAVALNIAYQFSKAHESVFGEALQIIDRASEKRKKAERNTKQGKWGYEDFDADVDGISLKNLVDSKRVLEIADLSSKFDGAIRKLLHILGERLNDVDSSMMVERNELSTPSSPLSGDISDNGVLMSEDDSLRFLAFKLDFSEYYSQNIQ